MSRPRSPSSPWPQTSRGLHILTCKIRAGISAAVRLPPGLQLQSCPASQTKWHLSCTHFHVTFSPFCFLSVAQHTQVFRTSSSFRNTTCTSTLFQLLWFIIFPVILDSSLLVVILLSEVTSTFSSSWCPVRQHGTKMRFPRTQKP